LQYVRGTAGVHLRLGPRSLATNIDKPDDSSKERDCKMHTTNKLTSDTLVNVSQIECEKNSPTTRTVTVKKTAAGFDYTIVFSTGDGEPEKTITCELNLKK
jgi:hypothetical protein